MSVKLPPEVDEKAVQVAVFPGWVEVLTEPHISRAVQLEIDGDVPLPEGWETGAASIPPRNSAPLQIPAYVLEHRAVLTLPDGTPFSTVIETYTDDVLAFPEPPLPEPGHH